MADEVYREYLGKPTPDVTYALRQEDLTITVLNTIPDLSYTPREPSSVTLFVSGIPQTYTTDFSVSGKSITWSSSDFNINPGDDVKAVYESTD